MAPGHAALAAPFTQASPEDPSLCPQRHRHGPLRSQFFSPSFWQNGSWNLPGGSSL